MTFSPLGCIPVLLLILTGTLLTTLSLPGGGSNDRRRVEREVESHSLPWSTRKIEANIAHRLPLIDALGYLAYRYGKDYSQSWQDLHATFLDIDGQRHHLMNGLALRGNALPRDLVNELAVLKQSMLDTVREHYGAVAVEELTAYLKQRRQQNRFLIGN